MCKCSSRRREEKKMGWEGIPWLSSGLDSAFSLPRAKVCFLVGELKSHRLRGVAKKKKKKRKKWDGKSMQRMTKIFSHFVEDKYITSPVKIRKINTKKMNTCSHYNYTAEKSKEKH